MIKNHKCLLNGELTFFLKSGMFFFRYNTVSEDTIFKLTGLIKEKMDRFRDSEIELPEALEYSLETMEHGYVTAAEKICRTNPQTRLLAYQPATSFMVPIEFKLSIL